MKIGFDARLIRYRRGMGNYAYHVLHALARLDVDAELVAFLDCDDARSALPADSRIRASVLRPRAYPIWEQWSLPLAVRRQRLDVLHCMFNTAPLIAVGSPLVVTIHDVMFLLPDRDVPKSPLMYHELGRRYRAHIVRRIARHAAHIMTDSEHSAIDIRRVLGVPPGGMTVVHCGVDPEFLVPPDPVVESQTRRRLGVTTPYVFALGAIDPRKNTARLIDAFVMARKGLAAPPRLVVAGLSDGARRTFHALASERGVEDDVSLLGFVSTDDLIALYRGAITFCYPSIYEGFGFPVIEAMASRTPVIASNTTSVGEIAGSAACLVDPLNTRAIADALVRVIQDEQRRAELVARGSVRVGAFSWEQVARSCLAVYRSAASTAGTLS